MESARERLVGDIKVLLTDVDTLYRQAAESTGDEAREVRRRAERVMERAGARIETIRQDVVRRGRASAEATDDWVHHNPWSSIGLVAGVGLTIGFLLARR